MSERPKVLFVCVKNAGKSQMAAGLMEDLVGDAAEVSSAGTRAGTVLNELSVQSLAEVGVDISGERPKAITDEMVRRADVVVTLGREAHVTPVRGDPPRAVDHELLQAFMTYVVSEEGQDAAAQVAGSAPISDATRDQSLAAINTITAS